MILTEKERGHIEGYAAALQAVMFELTGSNTCGKSYDPATVSDTTINSYAFEMKDGGRHHPLSDYESVDEIEDYMLKEAVSIINDN